MAMRVRLAAGSPVYYTVFYGPSNDTTGDLFHVLRASSSAEALEKFDATGIAATNIRLSRVGHYLRPWHRTSRGWRRGNVA